MVELAIGITGAMGSGKSLASNELQRLGFTYVSLSEFVTEEVARLGIKRSLGDRPIGQSVGDSMRATHGADILARLMIDKLSNLNVKRAVIDGIRNPAEVICFKEQIPFKLIGLVASPQNRYQRISGRGRTSDPQSWDEFLKIDSRDRGFEQPPYGQQVEACLKVADFVVENNSTPEEFLLRLNQALKAIDFGFHRFYTGES